MYRLTKILIYSLLSITSPILLGQDSAIDNLKTFQWRHRIILVNASSADTESTLILQRADAEIRDRDILWFVLFPDDRITNYAGETSQEFENSVRQQYFQDEVNNVVLIGKDGGVKLIAPSLQLDAIFARIDSMPMRQREMRERPQR